MLYPIIIDCCFAVFDSIWADRRGRGGHTFAAVAMLISLIEEMDRTTIISIFWVKYHEFLPHFYSVIAILRSSLPCRRLEPRHSLTTLWTRQWMKLLLSWSIDLADGVRRWGLLNFQRNVERKRRIADCTQTIRIKEYHYIKYFWPFVKDSLYSGSDKRRRRSTQCLNAFVACCALISRCCCIVPSHARGSYIFIGKQTHNP
jgi:hypothetical protein